MQIAKCKWQMAGMQDENCKWKVENRNEMGEWLKEKVTRGMKDENCK